jgi:hypothetical protein
LRRLAFAEAGLALGLATGTFGTPRVPIDTPQMARAETKTPAR